jgi:hypothetical protein
MNCKELVYVLGEYLDGSMEEQLRSDLDAHIALCDSCTNFLSTYDKTRSACRQVQLDEIPEEFRERLRAFVLEKAKEHHKGIEKYLKMAARERRQQAETMLRAYREDRLSPSLALLFRRHSEVCETCGAFLRAYQDGDEPPSFSEDLEAHLVNFLDALPPGEVPYRP